MCRPPIFGKKLRKEVKIMEKKEKSKNLSFADVERLKKRFSDLDTDFGYIGLGLCEELKFSLKTLKKLKQNINKNGVVVKMDQGKYEIDRANPALTQYNTLMKNYQSLSKQICEMLNQLETTEEDEFDSDDL